MWVIYSSASYQPSHSCHRIYLVCLSGRHQSISSRLHFSFGVYLALFILIKAMVDQYSQWKVLGWRYLRTALAAALSIMVVQLSTKDFKIDQALWSSLLAGAIAAVFKALRDDIGDPSDPNVINRLPL